LCYDINENNEVVGQIEKSFVHKQGIKHRVVAILVQRVDGTYLIPTASSLKSEAGKLYHSAAGHVRTGETYLAAAQRELKEETNLSIDQSDFIFLGTYWLEQEFPGEVEQARFEVYVVPFVEHSQIVFNEEQNTIQWFSKEQLLQMQTKQPEIFSKPLQITCNTFLSL
jgi:isopentenyl-diphosphate delta-isomerase